MERRSPHAHGHGSELVLSSDRDRLRVDDRHWHSHSGGRRRAHSAAPLRSPVDEEAEYITSRIDARGRHGEAWHGATKDWTIVDVLPGTERVRMDGAGGGGAEVTWQRTTARGAPSSYRSGTTSGPRRQRRHHGTRRGTRGAPGSSGAGD